MVAVTLVALAKVSDQHLTLSPYEKPSTAAVALTQVESLIGLPLDMTNGVVLGFSYCLRGVAVNIPPCHGA